MTDAQRPQDGGRSHKRRGVASPETAALLTRYQAAMREELGDTLNEIRGTVSRQTTIDGVTEVKRPPIETRARLWDLAIKLGRELGAAIDADPPALEAAARRPRARGRVDYG